MSLTKMGGQVALTVTPEDLHHFANALLAQSRTCFDGIIESHNTLFHGLCADCIKKKNENK